jgi:hypothetical protein
MKTSEAKQITGGLSNPEKMPEKAFNLPAPACITGKKLVDVKGSVCEGCYALKGRYRFNNVQTALNRRLKALEHPQWVEAMVHLIKKQKHFRWHDSGDIQSLEHLKNIFKVCRATPDTQHWLPTREAQFIKRLKVNEVPRNLVIRFSSHMIDQAPVNFWPWTSTVVTDKSFTCPASSQDNKCGDCRQCWNRDIKNVSYPKH